MNHKTIRARTRSSAPVASYARLRPLAALGAASVLIASSIGACSDDKENTTTASIANRPAVSAGTGGGSASSMPNGTGGRSTMPPRGAGGSANAGTGGWGGSGPRRARSDAGIADGGVADAGDAGIILALDGGVAPDAGLAATAQLLTDGQIVFTADALIASEIAQAQVALPRLTRADVQAFARQTIDSDQALRHDLRQVENNQGLVSAPSDLADQVRQETAAVTNALRRASASSVDTLYINTQVSSDSLALQMVDGFIAGADNQALRTFLETMRGDVVAHLTATRALQAVNPPNTAQ